MPAGIEMHQTVVYSLLDGGGGVNLESPRGTHRIKARRPEGFISAAVDIITEPSFLQAACVDEAHFKGGHTGG